jgi:DNA topoisomerase-1
MAARKSNQKSLVIVESPAKAKTINKYLGDDFVVKASMGHVRDLPERGFGIDTSRDFRPTYEILPSRRKVIDELKRLAANADTVYLATDLDREGESIAWHLAEALELPADRTRRVIFNEITKSAVQEAFKNPHQIDIDRVNAQQARRILDRIVGYELSPLLWRKIAKGLSAGRVQSVAVRLIVEREREIRAFVPEESWKLVAYITADPADAARHAGAWDKYIAEEHTQKDIQRWLGEHGAFRTELAEFDGKKFEPKNAEEARAVAEALGMAIREIARTPWDEYKHLNLEKAALVGSLDRDKAPALTVAGLETKRTTTRPSAPFTTSTLQQAASTYLRYPASRTMKVAQALYEGIDLAGEGPVGLITYMRTDSTNLSKEAVGVARDFIRNRFGDRYVPEKPNVYGSKAARAQEAHEAIRPTDANRTPESLRGKLTDEQYKLYDLIWRRFVACQMTPAEWDSTSVSIGCETRLGAARFHGSGRKLVFDGFMKVAGVSSEDQLLPPLEVNQPVGLLGVDPQQQFTSPPPRYTEASLVKTLESEGIGRPSTYAAIIDTIQDRGYVEQEDRKFFPTALGEVVTDKLVEHFPKIVDVKFTSYMEDELDKVEEAHLDWVHVLHEFYDPFKELLGRAGDAMEAVRSQPSDHKCPACGLPMVYRWSRTGRFLACTGYPDCQQTHNVDRLGNPIVVQQTDVKCPECGSPMVKRTSKSGPFLGCSKYPECRGTMPCDENGVPLKQITEEEARRPCEACEQGTLVVKFKRGSAFLGCNRYPECKQTAKLPPGVYVKKPPAPPPKEAGVKCEKCGRPMVIRKGPRGEFIACSGFPKCRTSKPIEKLAELQAASPMAIGALAEQMQAQAEAKTSSGKRGASKTAKGKAAAAAPSGPPPKGFAWTRTGRPVVEELPEDRLDCPECGNTMELRRGRFGPFFSCTNFPKCKFVANLRGNAKKKAEELMPAPAKPKPIPTDIPCDECGKPMLIREGRTGKFLGCSGYPKCKTTKELPPGFDLEKYEAAAEMVEN